MRLRFKGKVPKFVKVAVPLFAASVLLNIAMLWAIPVWSPTVPDSVHSVPFKFKNGATYFVLPSLARAIRVVEWLNPCLAAVCVILFLVHRDELERAD